MHSHPQAEVESATAPLTFQQEWALNHYMDDTFPYVIPLAMSIQGPLDRDALRRSLELVIRRHGSLRTRLIKLDGRLRQKIDEPRPQDHDVVKIPGDSPAELQTNAKTLLKAFFDHRIDLASDPLFDLKLLELSKQHHILALALHHLVVDGSSALLLVKELWTSYWEILQGNPSSLPTPPQYSDYATKQRRDHPTWLKQHHPYWEERMTGAARVRLPTDTGLENLKPFSAAVVTTTFGQSLSSSLTDLAREERVTPATVMLALYAEVLALWSTQRDFVIPVVVAGRVSSGHLGLLGTLAHYLPLRITLTGNETGVDLIRQVSQEFLTANDHLDFGQTVSHCPDLMKGTSFNWDASDFTPTRAPASQSKEFPIVGLFDVNVWPPGTLKLPFDTMSYFSPSTEGIRGTMLYRADRFTPKTMKRFFNNLQTIAECAVRDPRANLSKALS